MTQTVVDEAPGAPLIKQGYDPALTNVDLAPLSKQTWSSYNIFAFWMSDVHSVGGYVTAGSLFALGIASWQVLIALIAGIIIVQFFANLVAKPSQVAGVPYPVINRHIFGVTGANVPAIIRGSIAIAWYGVQTYIIVANFISPAFDFSNVKPQKISWRMGGMIAAIGSVLLTPWNWYDNATAIDYTLSLLGALIGPLFGVLICGYYVVAKQRVWVDDLYTRSPAGRYWFKNGWNPNAIWAVVIGGVPAVVATVIPTAAKSLGVGWISDYSWFIGCGLGFVAFWYLERVRPMITDLDRDLDTCRDGTLKSVMSGVTADEPAPEPA
jgi:cytosine/uracil/thiamine/allantoin permease